LGKGIKEFKEASQMDDEVVERKSIESESIK
jgi:Sec-independent protein translocase protein TatA